MKKGKGKVLSFVVLFALPQRMEEADTKPLRYEQGFLVKAAHFGVWR